jgi:hypothetical protein
MSGRCTATQRASCIVGNGALHSYPAKHSEGASLESNTPSCISVETFLRRWIFISKRL